MNTTWKSFGLLCRTETSGKSRLYRGKKKETGHSSGLWKWQYRYRLRRKKRDALVPTAV
jgi:hypothetical protein